MEQPFATLLKPDMDRILAATGGVWSGLRHGRLFLTGCSGFFGVWLLASLQAANHSLGLGCHAVVLSRNPSRMLDEFPQFRHDPCFEFISGDVTTFVYPKGAFTHAIHAATDTSRQAGENPLLLLDTIIEGTKRVLQFCGQAGVKHFLYLSSGAVYGTHTAAVSESFQGAPAMDNGNATYGLGKRLGEHLCFLYGQTYGMTIKIARGFAFVGPFMPMRGHFAIGNFIADAMETDTITVVGDGSPVRSYLYVADLVIWLWHILLRGEGAYNVGSDQAITIGELANLTAKVVAPEKKVSILGQSCGRNIYLPAIQRVREHLGLEIYTHLADAIRKTADWYRQRLNNPPKETTLTGAAKQLTFVVDIDGVVASLTPGNDYSLAGPLTTTIQAVNKLYDAGHRILLFTARGSATGIDWQEVTRQQLERWGVRYHQLYFGKPAADYYVDDRLISPAALSKMAHLEALVNDREV